MVSKVIADHQRLLRRVVRVTAQAGPVSRNGLHGYRPKGMTAVQLDALLDYWLAFGILRQYGRRREAKYGAPGWRGL